VFPVRHKHNLHIKSVSIRVNRLWRLVFPVRYEHRLHTKSEYEEEEEEEERERSG
jgi:plasmid maintenance system killer protein